MNLWFLKHWIFLVCFLINYSRHIFYQSAHTDSSGVQVVGLWPLVCWDCGFESHWGGPHTFFFFVNSVCCAGRGLCDWLITSPRECDQL